MAKTVTVIQPPKWEISEVGVPGIVLKTQSYARGYAYQEHTYLNIEEAEALIEALSVQVSRSKRIRAALSS